MNTDSTLIIRRPLGRAIRHHLTCLHHCLEGGGSHERRVFHTRRLGELERKLPEGCRLQLTDSAPCTVNVTRAYTDPQDGTTSTEIALILHLNDLDLHAEPAQRGKLYQQLAEQVTIILHTELVDVIG